MSSMALSVGHGDWPEVGQGRRQRNMAVARVSSRVRPSGWDESWKK